MAASAPVSSEPISRAGRWEIADQLSRVLVSPWFRTSSRCSQLLRHVVELSVLGQGDRLKERQIAVEVFHRKPTYDNNVDPVVRVAAGEVRKRLAQYYAAPENAGQIRIELPIGSYVPAFHFPTPASLEVEQASSASGVRELSCPEQDCVIALPAAENHASVRRARRLPRPSIAVACAVIALAAVAGVWREFRPAAQRAGFQAFWAPLLNSSNTPLISVGELHARELTFTPDKQRSPSSDSFKIDVSQEHPDGVSVEQIGALQAVARIASVLGTQRRPFEVRDEPDTSFADFAGRPTILIGAYENDWSMGLSGGRRFEFKMDYGRDLKWISDRQRPKQEIGALPVSSPEPSSYDSYAIVMRNTGTVSRQSRILLAGVGEEGTIAAADFVSNPTYLDDFARHAPRGWEGRNVEILLRTRVVEGVLGIPTVVDYSIW